MSKDTTGERAGMAAGAESGERDATARSLSRLDPLLQHRSRLGACVLLSTADALTSIQAGLGPTEGGAS